MRILLGPWKHCSLLDGVKEFQCSFCQITLATYYYYCWRMLVGVNMFGRMRLCVRLSRACAVQ